MGFIQSDRVGFVRVKCRVSASDESATDGDLGRQTDDRTCYVRCAQGGDGAVNIAGVRGEERAEEEEDFARAVGGGMAKWVSKGKWKGKRWETTDKRAPRAMSNAF